MPTATRTSQDNQARLQTPSEEAAEKPLATRDALKEALAIRNVDDAVWRSLCNSVFPGARPESIIMAIDYCRARKLDPLKKPCHIVPMDVKDAKTGIKATRDVIMPGIYEYRTTAHRTGLYMGHSEPVLEGEAKYNGGSVTAPVSCSMVFYRWSERANCKLEFPVKVYFDEVAMFKEVGWLNAKWTESPVQMLTKCTEAAGLREAFPEDIGGLHTEDEMLGRTINAGIEAEFTVARGKPHAEEPKQTAQPAGKKTWSKVPVVELAELIDKIGVPLNQFLAQFEIGELSELPLAKVGEAYDYLEDLLEKQIPQGGQ